MQLHKVFFAILFSLYFASCMPIPAYQGPQLHTVKTGKSEDAKFIDRWQENFGHHLNKPSTHNRGTISSLTSAADKILGLNGNRKPGKSSGGRNDVKKNGGKYAGYDVSPIPGADGPSDKPKYTMHGALLPTKHKPPAALMIPPASPLPPVVDPVVAVAEIIMPKKGVPKKDVPKKDVPKKDVPKADWRTWVPDKFGPVETVAKSSSRMSIAEIPPYKPKTVVMPANTLTVSDLVRQIVKQSDMVGCPECVEKKGSAWKKFVAWVKGAWKGAFGSRY